MLVLPASIAKIQVVQEILEFRSLGFGCLHGLGFSQNKSSRLVLLAFHVGLRASDAGKPTERGPTLFIKASEFWGLGV